jgi:D-beta-D-heptose 7-phosphate kinase/D-beta-D-heptose 1-phosphate adenosyltransferase
MPVETIAHFAGKRVLVIGDLMLDEFLWGKVSRISPEAPVPVVEVTGESYYPGGAANVARNLREFTDGVSVMGVAGADSYGDRLCALLAECGIDASGVQRQPGAVTTVKTRIIARNQQVVRVDRERQSPLTAEQFLSARSHLETAIADVDGVIVADYGKGFLNQELADLVAAMAHEHGKVFTVDPHPHTSLNWRGASVIKPNRIEAFSAAGVRPAPPVDPPLADAPLFAAVRKLRELWQPGSLLVTLSDQGMLLFEGDAAPLHIPARAQEVFDVSGAGDTAIAVLTLGLLAGAGAGEAADLANRASGIAVGKLGTATVARAELEATFA